MVWPFWKGLLGYIADIVFLKMWTFITLLNQFSNNTVLASIGVVEGGHHHERERERFGTSRITIHYPHKKINHNQTQNPRSKFLYIKILLPIQMRWENLRVTSLRSLGSKQEANLSRFDWRSSRYWLMLGWFN